MSKYDSSSEADGEDAVAKLNRQFEPIKPTAHRSVDSLMKAASSDLIVRDGDGTMSARPQITTMKVGNIPILNKELAEGTEEKRIENESKMAPEGQINRRASLKCSATYELEKFNKNAMIVGNIPILNKELAEGTEEKEEEEKGIENESKTAPEGQINSRALLKCSATYELENFNKNAMIIFNQKTIPGYEVRLGTDKDVEALEYTFKRFGFEVKKENDLLKAELLSKLDDFSNTDFTDYGCVAVVVLTHGSERGRLYASDMPFYETDLINCFMNKPFLVSKPILFIIQACRGNKDMAGILARPPSQVQKDHSVEPYTLPTASDILVVHSAYYGNPSHRNVLQGSWFIQTLCSKINTLADSQDLYSILTEMLREVAVDYQEASYKQMPTLNSTLIRKLYLCKISEDDECCVRTETGNKVWHVAAPQHLRLRYGKCTCTCFLRHFEYIKKCLRYFVEENPSDIVAQGYLDVAYTFNSERGFDTTKQELLRAMCNYLTLKAQDCPFYKYVYLNYT